LIDMSQAMSSLPDRRQTPRHRAIENRGRLEWPGGASEVQVLNISGGGALLMANLQPPADQALSLRLESPVETDWVPARVVRYDGAHALELAFNGRRPEDLILAVTLGIDFTGLFLGQGGREEA
jgi:hypothetical protein